MTVYIHKQIQFTMMWITIVMNLFDFDDDLMDFRCELWRSRFSIAISIPFQRSTVDVALGTSCEDILNKVASGDDRLHG